MAKRRPNIIDLLILVVVVALVAVGVYKFGVVDKNMATSSPGTAPEQVTFEASGDRKSVV